MISHWMWSVGPHRAQSHSLGSPGSTVSRSRCPAPPTSADPPPVMMTPPWSLGATQHPCDSRIRLRLGQDPSPQVSGSGLYTSTCLVTGASLLPGQH